MLTLDDLDVLDSVMVNHQKLRKPTKVELDEAMAAARAYGIAHAERMYFLKLALEKLTLDEVIELWHKVHEVQP